MESNKESYDRALTVLRPFIRNGQVALLHGYSTDQSISDIITAEQRDRPVGAILQEIVGVIASSEGLGSVIGHLKWVLGPRASSVCYVPSIVATYYTLVNIEKTDVVASSRDVYVNQGASTLLVR